MKTKTTTKEAQLIEALIALKNSTDWFMVPFNVKQQVEAALKTK